MQTLNKTASTTKNFDKWLLDCLVERESDTQYRLMVGLDYENTIELELITEGLRTFWGISTDTIFDKFDRQRVIDEVELFMWNQENQAS